MMLFAEEMKRAIKNKYTLAALLIGTAICLWHFFSVVLPMRQYLDFAAENDILPHSVYSKWIGATGSEIQTTLYFLIMPILASLPFANSFFTDIKDGYAKVLLIKRKKSSYLNAKFAVVFISGGIVFVLPLILNFVLSATVLPMIKPDASSGLFPIYASSFLPELYYGKPFLYTLFYLLIDFCAAGIFACMALPFSSFLSNRYIVLLSPFLVYFIWFAISSVFFVSKYCPYFMIRPDQPATGLSGCLIFFTLALLAGAEYLVFMLTQRKKDVF